MEVSGQFHPSAALPPRRETSLGLKQQAGSALETVWMLWNRESFLPLSKVEPGYSVRTVHCVHSYQD